MKSSKKSHKKTDASKKSRRPFLLGMFCGALLLVLASSMFAGVHVVSDATGFCIKCHPDHGEQWQNSTHKTIDCAECHIDPGIGGAIQAKIGGLKNLYVSITRGNDVERTKDPLPISTKNCISCHNGILYLNELGYEDLPDNSLKVDGLVMGHRIHVEKHGIDCVWCHRGTVHRDKSIVGKYEFNMPLHSDCAVCHSGERMEQYDITLPHVEDKEECKMCHPTYEPGG